MAGGPAPQPYDGVVFPQSGIYEFGYWTLLKLGRPSWRPGDGYDYIAIFETNFSSVKLCTFRSSNPWVSDQEMDPDPR
jgi:hypothetical protein